MNKLNILFSLSSLSVILVTVERVSPTTRILLQPYNFLRLHEIVQMTFLILFTVVIPFLILREITNNFETLKIKQGFILFLIFLIGVYFYSTGNGLHEVSSFNFNNYCNIKNFSGNLCNGFFINNYYTGNIYYFFGAALIVIAVLFLERLRPPKEFNNKQVVISLLNAFIYAFAIFAYAAFDRVVVGLVYSLIVMIIAVSLFLTVKKKYRQYPITTYTAATYTLGTIAAIIVRFH